MTLTTACTPRVVIVGNGTLGPYSLVDASSVAIRLVSTGHLKLTRYAASTDDNNDGTLLVLNTDYTVGGTQDARTFTLIGSQAVLTSSQRIVAERVQNYTQDLDLTTGGAFNASSLESRFDKLAEFQQELKARLDRVPALQFADTTANVAFPSPPTSATQVLARNTSGEIVHATAASLDVDVVLGTDWATILGLPAAGTLDNLSGVRFVATYAALTALTTATGLADNAVYFTYARATEEDGGSGFWRYDSGSSATANGGTILAIDGGGVGRFFRVYSDEMYARWFGVVADGTTNDAAAFTAAWDACAAAGGGVLWVPEGTTKFTTQVTLNGSHVTVRGMGRKCSIISSSYAVGPAIILGNNSTQTVEYAFEDMRFTGIASQTFFKSRYVRGLYFRRIYEVTDRFLWLGDSAATTGKPTYIVHIEDCPDSAQIASPTLHHIYAENFAGQFTMSNAFIEGQYTASIDGFYATDNIQTRIDHVIVSGGYFGRFRDSYSFVDARVTNMHIDMAHESEGALRNSVRLEVTTSTSKTTAQVGWSNVMIAGKYASSADTAIYLKCERASVSTINVDIGQCVFTSETIKTPVVIEGAVGPIVGVNIHDITVEFTPTDASQDVVKIIGGSSIVTVDGVGISNIAGYAAGTALRSVVRVEGIVDHVTRPKNIGNVKNATTELSDARLQVLDEYEYIQEPEGRLTLTTATPVLSSSVTAATSIYYTPFKGNRIPLLTGTKFCERAFTELTLALDSNVANTGYQQSGKNFDLFVYNNAGTLRLCSGPAWTNDTTRSAELTMLRGILVNNATITLKYDATSATISAAANSALYVGTMRASADGQTEMSLGAPTAAAGGTANKLYLWNAHRRMPVTATCRDSVDTYTYTTAVWQSKNASDSNRIGYVLGLSEGTVRARATAMSANSTANIRRYSGIGYNVNNAATAGGLFGAADNAASNFMQMSASFDRAGALGFHFLQEVEYSTATGTTTWYGDGGGASVIQTGMTLELMM